MNIKVKSLQLFTNNCFGPDYIFLTLDIPEGSYPYKDYAVAKLTLAAGAGKAYIKTHFSDVESEIIDYDYVQSA